MRKRKSFGVAFLLCLLLAFSTVARAAEIQPMNVQLTGHIYYARTQTTYAVPIYFSTVQALGSMSRYTGPGGNSCEMDPVITVEANTGGYTYTYKIFCSHPTGTDGASFESVCNVAIGDKYQRLEVHYLINGEEQKDYWEVTPDYAIKSPPVAG